jgi:hypothetical protein
MPLSPNAETDRTAAVATAIKSLGLTRFASFILCTSLPFLLFDDWAILSTDVTPSEE